MATLRTIRVREDWIQEAVKAAGGVSNLAKQIRCDPATVSRNLNGLAEAGPRFMAAVLSEMPVDFDDAFKITEEELKPRSNRKATGNAA